MIPIFKGKVEKGRLIWNDPEKRAVYIASLEGKEIEETIKKAVDRRTTQANKYLWGVCYAIISESTGYDPEQVHIEMKRRFASKRVPYQTQNGIQDEFFITESTRKMDSVRFTKYVDDVKKFAAEFLGLYIPEAGEIAI